MKTFGDLRVTGDAKAFDRLGAEIEARLKDGWTRGVDEEQELHSMDDERPLCFKCNEREGREAAGVFLYPDGAGGMYVSNIVPSSRGRLSESEYNAILSEFHDRYVSPAARVLGLTTELQGIGDVSLTYWMSEEAAKALERFSHAANKSTGSSHPMDRERFFAFLVATHRHGKSVPTDALRTWLIEEGWDEESATELVIEYEFGLALLVYFCKAC